VTFEEKEPQEQVRARILTIEEQIQQLMEKKLELQNVAKIVTKPGGTTPPDGEGAEEMPPGIEPSIAGTGMRLPARKDLGKGVGPMDHGPPVMPMFGHAKKDGDASTEEDELETASGVVTEPRLDLRVSSQFGSDAVV